MIVIVDGYNVLKQIFYKVKGKLDKQREQFIRQLGHYKNKKSEKIKDIIVVFDGGHVRHATREVHSGVVVVFSGQADSADEWIFKWVKKHKNEELLLVSMDKELKSHCRAYGADAIDVHDFYNLVQDSILEDIAVDQTKMGQGSIEKYEDDFDIYYDDYKKQKINEQALDLLMEQSSFDQYKKDGDFGLEAEPKKGKTAKMSKKEKKVYRKIKKL